MLTVIRTVHTAPNVIVTRSTPVASIFRLKKVPPSPLPQLGITTVSGLQMRSVTSEVRSCDASSCDLQDVNEGGISVPSKVR